MPQVVFTENCIQTTIPIFLPSISRQNKSCFPHPIASSLWENDRLENESHVEHLATVTKDYETLRSTKEEYFLIGKLLNGF